MTPRPVAYIRKSTKGGQDSKADQIAGAAELASRHGDVDDLLVLDGDWAISAAREKTTKRLDFMRLMSMVEAGEVSALYATDADRLARSVQWASRLGDACKDHGVVIHTPVRSFDLNDEADWTIWTFAALTNESEVKKVQRKAAARVARQRERGTRLGQAPYGERQGEDLQAVLQAFEEAGSYNGAARLLIERGVKSRRGHLFTPDGIPLGWSASTVKAIVKRETPDKVPVRPRQGARTIAIRRFTRLLVCPHDGSFLTSQAVKRGRPGYICRIGHRDPANAHPRPYALREQVVLDWVQRQVAMLLTRRTTVTLDDTTEADVTALQAKRERLGQVYVDGAITDAAYRAALQDIDEQLDRLAGAARARITWQLGIDWRQSPGEVNARLRDLLTSIQLGYVKDPGPVRGRHSGITTSLVPVGAIWRQKPEVEVEVERGEWEWLANSDAEPVSGGWYLASTVDTARHEQRASKGRHRKAGVS